MAKKTTAYEAEDGSLHKSKTEAARADVQILADKVFGGIDGWSEKSIAEELIKHREKFILVLSAYHREAPPEKSPTDSTSEKALKGPVEGPKEDPPATALDGLVEMAKRERADPVGRFIDDEDA